MNWKFYLTAMIVNFLLVGCGSVERATLSYSPVYESEIQVDDSTIDDPVTEDFQDGSGLLKSGFQGFELSQTIFFETFDGCSAGNSDLPFSCDRDWVVSIENADAWQVANNELVAWGKILDQSGRMLSGFNSYDINGGTGIAAPGYIEFSYVGQLVCQPGSDYDDIGGYSNQDGRAILVVLIGYDETGKRVGYDLNLQGEGHINGFPTKKSSISLAYRADNTVRNIVAIDEVGTFPKCNQPYELRAIRSQGLWTLYYNEFGSDVIHESPPYADPAGMIFLDTVHIPTVGKIVLDNVNVLVGQVNTPPSADAGGPYLGSEGQAVMLDGSGSFDPLSNPLSYFWNVDSDQCSFDDPTIVNPSVICTDNGSYTVGLTVDNGQGNDNSDTILIVNNVPPNASFVTAPSVEGSDFYLSLAGIFDPSVLDTEAGLEISFDCGDGNGYGSYNVLTSINCPTEDNGARNVGAKIRDKDAGESEYQGTVIVTNADPVVGPIVVDNTSGFIGMPLNVSAPFTDPGTDEWTATWDWGDGTKDFGEISGKMTFSSHVYTSTGNYEISVVVEDDDGGAGSAILRYVVVINLEAGFVTGGGWFDSPQGAYTADPSLTGKAHFGFVSRYQEGETTPSGNIELQFKAGNLNFHSSDFDWLQVAGSDFAMFTGIGRINGEGDYKFQIWAGGGETDTFRIKVWEEIDGIEVVIYDNGMNQPIGGGSVVVHDGK